MAQPPASKLNSMRALRLLALASLVAACTCSGTALAQKNAPLPEAKAGLVTRDITSTAHRNWRGAPEHKLHVTIWYPAADTAVETPQFLGPPEKPLFEADKATPHAPFAPSLEPFPLILLSHGSGGSAAQLAWLATALARAGLIAAAVDHPGNHSGAPLSAEGFLLPWERATDLSEVLDGLLADPEIAPHIDKERIGAAGFSIGGYTVLELAGARTDISVLTDLCRKDPQNTTCHTPEMRSMGTLTQMLDAVRKTSGESLARSADSFRDPRVRAVFAIAPALGMTQTPESLHAIRVPTELVVGAADTMAPAALNANLIKAHLRGARETILPNVAHFTFLDVCTVAGKEELPLDCTDPPGVDRNAVHQQVDDLAIQFFVRAFRLH